MTWLKDELPRFLQNHPELSDDDRQLFSLRDVENEFLEKHRSIISTHSQQLFNKIWAWLVKSVSTIFVINRETISNPSTVPGNPESVFFGFRTPTDGSCLIHSILSKVARELDGVPSVRDLRQEMVDSLRSTTPQTRAQHLNEHAGCMADFANRKLLDDLQATLTPSERCMF